MKSETISRIPKSKFTMPIEGRDHIQGPIDAPVMLLEYGDYECPHCGAAYPVIKEVQERLGDRLCFAFRNFPLVNLHAHAQHAAEAAEAAGAQGRYWEMHDLLFERQDALEDADLAEYASSLELDVQRFMDEIRTGSHMDRVRGDFRSGARGGVNGTPTLFFNGVLFSDRLDVDTLLSALAPRELR